MNDIILNIKENKREIQLIAEALSNKTRINLLEEIEKNKGDCSHKKLAELIGVKSASITFHLNSLVAAGLVEDEEAIGELSRKAKKPHIKTKHIIIDL